MEEKPIFVCEEMKKLRGALDKKGIQWADQSGGIACPICVTKFKIGRTKYSVSNGYGTYGGYWERKPLNKGLLEVMRNSQEPKGYLTAQQVLEYCGIGGEELEQRQLVSEQDQEPDPRGEGKDASTYAAAHA